MSPTAPALPAGAALGFSYEYGIDIDTAWNPASPVAAVWQTLRRISAVAPGLTPVTASAQTYDDFGAPNDQKTSEAWTLAFSIQVNRLASGAYAPEVEQLKTYTEPSAIGTLASAHVRWYDKPASGTANSGDAYEGYGTVSIERGNTDTSGVGTWNVTITGQGARTKIVNPFAGWAAVVPLLSTALPTAVAVGGLVTITGSGFSSVVGAAGVKFNAINATSYVVVDNTKIVAVMPAGTAGSAPVIVTSPAGASSPLAYTRGA
jgi:hypothetical protein